MVFVNGWLTLLAVFLYTPGRGSWLYTPMASAAAGVQGVCSALDILITDGKIAAEENADVVAVAGDSSMYDMARDS
jgi:pyruvate ferredoxin oxidoreductase beta subunit